MTSDSSPSGSWSTMTSVAGIPSGCSPSLISRFIWSIRSLPTLAKDTTRASAIGASLSDWRQPSRRLPAARSGRLLGDHLHAATPEGVRDHCAPGREEVTHEAPVIAHRARVGGAEVRVARLAHLEAEVRQGLAQADV